MPMALRLEAIDPQHANTVALLFGPLVLFAITDNQPLVTRADLLAAKRISQRRWQVGTPTETLKLAPFIDIEDEGYSTYLQLT